MDQREEETFITLSPDGISPWNHRANVDERGCLTLAWAMANGGERVRTFTQEETLMLYNLLRERLEPGNKERVIDMGPDSSGDDATDVDD